MMGREVPFSADVKHSASNHASSSVLHNPHSRSSTASYNRVTGPNSPGTFNFLDIINEVLQCNELASVGLAQFTRLSCKLDPRTAQQSASDRLDLWPCPPPVWKWTGPSALSPARRKRKKHLACRNHCVQQIVCCLNWEALGHPVHPPPQAIAGYGYSPSQFAMIERLEGLVDYFLAAGDFDSASLGRSAEKLDALLSVCRELPGQQCQDVDLAVMAESISRCLDPYGKQDGSVFSPSSCMSKDVTENCVASDFDLGEFGTSSKGSCPSSNQSLYLQEPLPLGTDIPCPKMVETNNPPSTPPKGDASVADPHQLNLGCTAAKPVVVSRIKWDHSPSFDPIPYLTDPVVKRAFISPDTLRLPEHLWVKAPRGKVHCSKAEVLKLAEKWDSKGACALFMCSEVAHDEAVGIFAVAKDETHERLILNPVVTNGRMQHYSNYTRSLAPGSLVSLIQLAEDEVLRISADDLSEMYYTFKVPPDRARRNCIRTVFKPQEIQHLSCFDPSKHTGPCFVALAALAMGDSLAVEIAQQAHFQVLSQVAGCLLEHERVAYRRAFPRGPFYEFLSIDDHLGLQRISKSAYKASALARDDQVFQAAAKAYRQVGLVQHPRKRKRHEISGTFLGAEIDGAVGRVSAPRHRIGLLMLCTSILAKRGTATPKLLSSILGSWINVLMYRRPIMSVMSAVFNEGKHVSQHTVFELSRKARNELLALCILGPLCQTDLRVGTCEQVFCMDASPHGGAICSVQESKHVVNEMWRHSEQRGFYTKLENPAASVLKELGIDSEPSFGPSPVDPVGLWSTPVPKHLAEGFIWDCLELFRGEGNWSAAHEQVGLRVHPGVEIKDKGLSFGDLLDDSVFHEVLSLALRGVVRDWHAGTPCRTYGTLRRPRIRSKVFPAGFDLNDPLTQEHNKLARRTAYILLIALQSGSYVSVEQPGSSVMFLLHAFKNLVLAGCILTKFCFCQYGSAFKKPSKWLHNKPWLTGLACKCRCPAQRGHFVIQGSFTRNNIPKFEKLCNPDSVSVYGRTPNVGEAVAAFSGSYPIPLCTRMAQGSLAQKSGSLAIIPLSLRVSTYLELGLEAPVLPLSGDDESDSLDRPSYRPWYEDAEWIAEYSDSVHFKELLRYRFRKSNHINVLESRVYKTWVKHCAKHHHSSRILGLLDSRVTLGATAKGRSSSPALTHVLQGALGYVLGGCLYPGGLHIMSEKNRSDGPSRNRPVPPASKSAPRWLTSLRAGNTDDFDLVISWA